MNRKRMILAVLIALAFLAGCASTAQLTPAGVYQRSQTAYLNAWTSYHNVWLALPATDARKAAWVKDYHPKFDKAGELLQKFRVDGTVATSALVDQALAELETILIQLAIKKGV